MTEYYERSTNVGGSTSEGISPGRGKVCLRLAQKDGSEGVILNLSDVYYLPRSPCNLVSLGRLNNHDIFHNNEHETLYHVKTRKILAHAQRWNNSYLLTSLNVTDSAIQLTKTSEDDTYDCPQTYVHRTSETKLSLTSWHKRLGHFNFPSLRKHLQRLKISFIDDSEKHVCDSCQRAKATKIYNRQNPQERAKFPFEFIHTDLVGPIRPIGFGGSAISSPLQMTLQDILRLTQEQRKAIGLSVSKRFTISARPGPTRNDQSIDSVRTMDPNYRARG